MLRSLVPGYLLAAASALALGGWVTWEIVQQAEAIREAEARTPPLLTVEVPNATARAPASVPSSPETTGTMGGAVSQLTTTGAVVAAPSATPDPTTPHGPPSAERASPAPASAPLAPRKKPARANIAPPAAAPRPLPAKPHPGLPHAHRKVRKPVQDNGSKRSVDSTPAPSPSAAPAPTVDPNHLFDMRE
jgi:hypothetical protein